MTPSVTLLRDIDMARLDAYRDRIDATDYQRAYHVITENERVLDAVAALEADDHAALGELMAGSQASMRERYAITCPEIDALVEIDGRGARRRRLTHDRRRLRRLHHHAGPAAMPSRPLREHVEREYPARTGCTPRFWTVSAVPAPAREPSLPPALRRLRCDGRFRSSRGRVLGPLSPWSSPASSR